MIPNVKLEEWDEKRIDIIGQNGNDGLHYGEYNMSGGIEEMYREINLNKLNQEVPAWERTTQMVIKDMIKREAFGLQKYGKYLSPRTDEDMLQHLYEELMDGAVYIKTLIEQRKNESHGRCC